MRYDEYGDCPRCGQRDYGFELPDIRQTAYISNCRCRGGCVCTDAERQELDCAPGECICAENGCECDHIKIQIRINRVWDQRCDFCEEADYRCEFEVLQDGRVIATVPSESAAEAVIEAEFPEAEGYHDDAWESEQWLRRAEGWG